MAVSATRALRQHAAVDLELGAGDEFRLVSGEVEDAVRHVVGLADPLQRDAARQAFVGLGLVAAGHGDEGIEDGGLDEDRVDRVAAHVPVALGGLKGDGLGVHPHRRLGGVIGPHAGGGGQSGDRADIDDRGRGRGPQVRHGVFAAQHDGFDIDRLDAAPILQRVGLDEFQVAADARVVDQDRQPAHGRDGLIDDRNPFGLVGDVVAEGKGRAGDLGVDCIGQGPDALQIDVGDRHLGTLARQHPRHGLAQPASRPGDEGLFARDPSRLVHHHFAPASAAARSIKRAMSRSLPVTPPASWVVSRMSTRLYTFDHSG